MTCRPPAELTVLRAWLTWRYEQGGTAKPRKVPYYADGSIRRGKQGSPDDLSHLVTYDEALAAAAQRGMSGVGLAMIGHGYTALDFDNVTDLPAIEPLIAGTYAEWSPGGNGVRAIVRGSLGDRKSRELEIFSTAGFVTVTGNPLYITKMTDALDVVSAPSPLLLDRISALFGSNKSTSEQPSRSHIGLPICEIERMLSQLDPDMPNPEWYRVAQAICHETEGSEEGYAAFDAWSSTGSKYRGPDDTRRLWDRCGRRNDGALATIGALQSLGAKIDEFEVLQNEAADRRRFAVAPLDAFVGRPPPKWLIKGVIPRSELVLLVGESGAGKSFIALQMAGCIARGISWRGAKVAKGRVVYIAAEGAGGFRNRAVAYCQQEGIDPAALDIGVIGEAPNLLQAQDVKDLISSIQAHGTVDLIVIDTLAQTTPGGDENAAQDMGRALANCKALHRATGAVIMLIHHHGKDTSRGARGWSGIKAAADAELEVLRTPAGRMVRASKQKDGEDGKCWGFDLQPVTIGMDDDGDPITSCIVEESEVPTAQQIKAAQQARGPVELRVIEVVSEMAQAQTAGIEIEAVTAEVMRRWPAEEGKRDTRRQRISRAVTALCTGDTAPYFREGDTLSVG